MGKLRKKTGMSTLRSLCRKRLEWLGHVIRMDGRRLVSKVWGAECEGRRAKGKPRWMYRNQKAEDLARGSLSRVEALDREMWRRKVSKINKPVTIPEG
jgi:hypothetical protein